MTNVFKNEFGEYYTYPDGDPATIGEIVAFEVEQQLKVKS